MGDNIVMEIPLGYSIVKKVKTVNLWDAENILTSKAQRYYTEAIRKENSVDLVGNYIICPHCNSSFAANNKCSLFQNRWYIYNERVPKKKVREWSARQLSLFEDNQEKSLYISTPIDYLVTFKCPICGKETKKAEKNRYINILSNNDEIIIKCEITNINEVFALKWTDEENLSVTFPMFELVIFNFDKGCVYAALENSDGEIISRKNITNCPEKLEFGAVYNAVSSNKIVNRVVKRLFSKAWDKPLPYYGKDITIPNLFKMTMFVGYNKEFYNYIPYKLNSCVVDESFKNASKDLHVANNVVQIYKDSKLPNVKSIRKIFFEQAGLFFYIKEAEKLFEVINDINVFCSFLKTKYTFEILSDLHMRPGLIEYLKDYALEKGQKELLKILGDTWYDTREAAIDYNCMSDDVKILIRENWKSCKSIGRIVLKKSLYSVPMNCSIKNIADCNIDGYNFFWLKNTNDYAIAGEKLKNCLGTWRVDNWPVVCVKKDEEFLAAIQVCDEGVIQALGYNNSNLRDDENLYNVVEKWMKRFDLVWVDNDFDDE